VKTSYTSILLFFPRCLSYKSAILRQHKRAHSWLDPVQLDLHHSYRILRGSVLRIKSRWESRIHETFLRHVDPHSRQAAVSSVSSDFFVTSTSKLSRKKNANRPLRFPGVTPVLVTGGGTDACKSTAADPSMCSHCRWQQRKERSTKLFIKRRPFLCITRHISVAHWQMMRHGGYWISNILRLLHHCVYFGNPNNVIPLDESTGVCYPVALCDFHCYNTRLALLLIRRILFSDILLFTRDCAHQTSQQALLLFFKICSCPNRVYYD
jgi:hypothetical protein